jgi:transposase
MTGMEQDNRTGVVIGLDLGDRSSSFCVMVNGEVEERGEVRMGAAPMARWLAGRGESRLVLEAGSQSAWISQQAEEAGVEVLVLNPMRVELISRSEKKSDRSDAEWLAYLGGMNPERLGLVHHRQAEVQADLAVVRSRAALVRARTLLINQVRGTVKTGGSRLPGCDADQFHKTVVPFIPAALRPALMPLVNTIGHMTEEILAADKEIERLCREKYPETERLRQIKGVGAQISLTYVLTIADPARFKQSEAVGAYLGLVPKRRQSGKHDPELGISKAGDKYLRSLLVEAAHYIVGKCGEACDLKRWAEARLARGGGQGTKNRTIVAVARKLAVLLHRLWVSGEPYDKNRQARRQTPMVAS